jgi:hypothetical protein
MTIEFIIIGIIVVAILFVIVIILMARKRRFSQRDQKFFQKHWQEIENKATSDPNHAILDADKLLDKALAMKGMEGSLGEKLKKGKNLFRNINNVWGAHKLRNQIAHEINFHAPPGVVSQALSSFKNALRDLGIQL